MTDDEKGMKPVSVPDRSPAEPSLPTPSRWPEGVGIDGSNSMIQSLTTDFGPALPEYVPWRRMPEWEPHGRWLRDRPQLSWPDTVIPSEAGAVIMRLLLLISVLLGQLTITGSAAKHLLAFGVSLSLWAWIEWWITWDVRALSRRLLAWTVQIGLTCALVVLSPLGGIIVWAMPMVCGNLFTGWLLIGSLMISALPMTAIQVGGFGRIPDGWVLSGGLFLMNLTLNLIVITVISRREGAVMRRAAITAELFAAQQTSAGLQDQLVARARLDGIASERARLARDLHDTVAQGLVAVVTQLEAIPDGTLTAVARSRVENAKELAREGLTEARRAVHALRPIILDEMAFVEALERLVAEWSGRTSISAHVRIDGDSRTTDSDAELIRIAQESLANVEKHADARSVTFTLTYLEEEVLLDIRDDGRGFDPARVRHPELSGGHGLPGMAQRLALAGGRFAVESEIGSGCVVSAAVPG